MRDPRDRDVALLVQHDQTEKAALRVEVLREQLVRIADRRAEMSLSLDDLEAQVAELRANLGVDLAGSSELADTSHFDPSVEERLAIEASLPTFPELRTLPLDDERGFRAALDQYAYDERLELDSDPIALILNPSRVREVSVAWQTAHARLAWDRWDYAIVGGAALVGAVLDVALVSVPPGSRWKGVEYAGSPLTRWMNERSREVMSGDGWGHRLQQAIERWAKVPFDIANNAQVQGEPIPGLRPAMHRIMSPGHDPVLGFIFGVLDLLRGTCTLIDRTGVIHLLRNGDGVSLPLAIIKLVAHLLSDIPTAAGLPPPFFTALQLITGKTPFTLGPSGEPASIADLSRWMYGQGYDLRHFATMSVVPTVVEAIVRVGFFARHRELVTAEGEVAPNVSLKRTEMLTLAHALTASTNVMKAAVMSGNPLALNQAVWMSLAWNFVRWMRAQSAHDRAVADALEQGWRRLAANTP